MNIRNLFQKVLMAAAVVVIGMGMVSCFDNIDNSVTPSDNQQEQQAQDAQQVKAQKFWSVVSQLVDVDDYTDDYEGKTFEPVYGVKGAEAGTRYVYTNDAATAAERFADLVEQGGIDETTEKYTYDDPDVGRLVYTKGTGRFLATVEVSIKQIPSLKKIVYMPGAYANGYFPGRAYYRFGDVVSRKATDYEGNEITEYWICVRPSFGPEKKGDSHWVCLNALPEKNTKKYESSNNHTYYLPKGLGKSKEHMQNLAEMLYAITHPDDWYSNVKYYHTDRGGLRSFHDFSYDTHEYHNKYFWRNVQQAWKENKILQKAMNMTDAQADSLFYNNDNLILRLLYEGYSWWTMTSWNCTLYEATYKKGEEVKYWNMHEASYKSIPQDMKNIEVDFRQSGPSALANYSSFFGDNNPRWTVRHATGKELDYDGYYEVDEKIDSVKEVYRYYNYVIKGANLNEAPEETPENYVYNASTGSGTYMIGDVVKDDDGNRWFCINGSPASPRWPTVTDNTAWFITFDFHNVNTAVPINGLPEEEDLPELALRLKGFLESMILAGNDYGFKKDGKLGKIAQHIKDYTGIDWHHLIVPRDSVWSFTINGNKFDSQSVNIAFGIGYNNDTKDRNQLVARVIFDDTQAGTYRTACSTTDELGRKVRFELPYVQVYKHYQTYQPEKIREATTAEKNVGMTKWNLPWAMTDEKMTLNDVIVKERVERFAADDKWVRLNVVGEDAQEHPEPRTMVEQLSIPAQFIGRYDRPVSQQQRNMFNEPVLFFRVMKVNDGGGKLARLTSENGTELHVVHLQNDKFLYQSYVQNSWVQIIMPMIEKMCYVDNELTPLPAVTGWQ